MANAPKNAFPPRFIFHGNAVAAEVFLTRIGGVELQKALIYPVTGQSSLPVIGGRSISEVLIPDLPSQLASVFFYTDARTSAEGVLEGTTAITTVESSVSNVRVTNQPAPGECDDLSPIVFRAGALSLSLISRHPEKGQPSIEFARPPLFQDLSFNGQPIQLELNTELMQHTRWDDLENRFRTDRKFFESCLFGRHKPDYSPTFGEGIPNTAGSFALTSFVRSIKLGDQVIPGHALEQRGFGTIYFGEILLNDNERRVTMVRMQLGSHHAGQLLFAESDPNGTPWPPGS